MDEYELKILLGHDLFDKGMRIIDSGGVSPDKKLADGISIFEITDTKGGRHIVLKRVYPTDVKADMYDCDCGSARCEHYSAVLISEFLTDDIVMTDESVIDRINGRISSLEKDITNDPEYDEEENYWDDWEIEKYDLEPHNDEVEEEHVADILSDIFDSVTDPNTSLELLNNLFRELDSMEFDNGGADNALRDYEDEICTVVSYADETIVAKYMSSWNHWGEPWIMKYLGTRAKELKDAAYDINLKNGGNSLYMRERMLENRDYDELIACRDGNPDDIIAVVNALLKNGEKVRASEYALELLKIEDPDQKVVDTMYSAGFVDEAAPHYLRIYRGSGGLERLERAFESDRTERKPYLDGLLERCKGISEYDPKLMTFLVKHGRGKDVARILKSVKYRPNRTYGNIDFNAIRGLSHCLNNNGYTEEAAKASRHVIDCILSANDNKKYHTIVEMIRDMENDEGFENISVPHSKYMEGLRASASKKRKFWAIYNGTYVEKKKKRYYTVWL